MMVGSPGTMCSVSIQEEDSWAVEMNHWLVFAVQG